MAKYASIKIKEGTKKSADRLMKKYEISGIEFYDSMVNYFDVTGVNPKDQKVLSPAEELKKFRDTIISFMRKQEKEFILPVFGKVDVTMARFFHYIENEAPKDASKTTPEIGSMLEEKAEGKQTENEDSKLAILDLKGKLSQQELINQKIKEGVATIFEKTEYKSTGLTKKLVVDMSQHDFDEIRNWLNRV